MYLVVINPLGAITSLDLRALAIWRLTTRTIEWPGSSQKGLALGIEYVAGQNAGTSGFTAVVAVNCLVENKEAVDAIARLGLSGKDKGEVRERFREGLKSLTNSEVTNKDLDDILIAGSALVECYHALMHAMWGFNPPLAAMGADAKGELQGWRWAILRAERYASWLADGQSGGISGSGMQAVAAAAVSAAFEPPKAAPAPAPAHAPTPAPVLPPGPAPAEAIAPPDPLAGIGPPPSTEKQPRKKKGTT